MTVKSKTPISDNAAVDAGWIIAAHSNGEFVPLSVAQELESELNAVRICFAEASQQCANNGRKQYLEEKWLDPLNRQILETKLADMTVYADKLARGLKMIASYDEDSEFGRGICPYGCDCPSIAQITLDLIKTGHSQEIET